MDFNLCHNFYKDCSAVPWVVPHAVPWLQFQLKQQLKQQALPIKPRKACMEQKGDAITFTSQPLWPQRQQAATLHE